MQAVGGLEARARCLMFDWKRFWQRILKLAQIWTFSSCEAILLRFHPCGSPRKIFFIVILSEFLFFFSCHVYKNNVILIKIFYYTLSILVLWKSIITLLPIIFTI